MDDDDEDSPLTKRHLKIVTDKIDQLLSSSSFGPYSEATLKAFFSSVVKEHDTSISIVAKAIDASTSQCEKASLAVEASTKECKDATAKVEKLISNAQILLYSLRAATQKNAQTVNASVDTLTRSLEAEPTQLEVVQKSIETANEELHTKVDTRLTQLEAELAVKNKVMDELDKRTSLLKIQNLKLRTATKEHDDLKFERELRPALDILSRIKGVPKTTVLPTQAGEKNSQGKTDKTQPPPPPETKATARPKDNVALASKSEKKKRKIGEDDVDEDDDVEDIMTGSPSKPNQKFKPSDQELQEKMDLLEKDMKEKELLEKTKLIFLEWTIESL
uniref:Uncharacterized protein n=1 Tax=Lactuca sativa TaxID=4236 RepID=A0A9R1VJ61_LACSA|nr:hypothetical protein LSAT_V11C500236450 [Lactuca sativa]